MKTVISPRVTTGPSCQTVVSLDGIASAHIEELSVALPGFAEAMAWPDGVWLSDPQMTG